MRYLPNPVHRRGSTCSPKLHKVGIKVAVFLRENRAEKNSGEMTFT